MPTQISAKVSPLIRTFNEFAQCADASATSFLKHLKSDPKSSSSGTDHHPRQVTSGHYVPVDPTVMPKAEYVAHSSDFFNELGLCESLVNDERFQKVFSGDLSVAVEPMSRLGWATGYALSIMGTEFYDQCPFGTGNGYGDGRAISVYEGILNGKRWEMQLKGAGKTPYCRGGDGRAVLRSSVREFLAQEYMNALGVPTTRSLILMTSKTQKAIRPWWSKGSQSPEPDILTENPVAISTRVASSFLRVGQIELFARRHRKREHDKSDEELQKIVEHVIDREYANEIDRTLPLTKQVLELAKQFRKRLSTLVAHWLRVGYCQGNFNSDNCAVGGFTLDYGPFGFCEHFELEFQPWTGGGKHYCFMNQPRAAAANYLMFCVSLRQLLEHDADALVQLETIQKGFGEEIAEKMEEMWASKLGLRKFQLTLFQDLLELIYASHVDFTIFFRELSNVPSDFSGISKAFYSTPSKELTERWQIWLSKWRKQVTQDNELQSISTRMKSVNPKYAWREWLVVPAYEDAAKGDYALVKELQEVFRHPYDKQSIESESKYYRLQPKEYGDVGGISFYSCSS